ncbi:MAG: molecular chaperone [Bacillota bacterium]
MSYRLNPGKTNYRNRYFTRTELLEMSTHTLDKICREYKIIQGYQNSSNRERLIELILKYRGKEISYLIDHYSHSGFNRLQNIVNQQLANAMNTKQDIKVPAKMIVHPRIGVDKDDMYEVIADGLLTESNVLLVNDEDYLCGIFNLKQHTNKENKYYLTAKSENLQLEGVKNKSYSFLFFNQKDSEHLYKTYYQNKELPPRDLKCYKVPLNDFETRDLEETKAVLCIDFGTSNTTAGAYLDSNYVSDLSTNDILNNRIKIDETNFVKFPYETSQQKEWIAMSPTVVYVLDCKDVDNLKFLFGHQAKKHMKQNDYSTKASVFQGIKRWVSTYQKVEEIHDEAGNTAEVTRGQLIKAYFNYIIEKAEHQFKCKFKKIHISSPVKLKSQFGMMFQEIISDYEIETKDMLDEGVSVLYNTIINQINKRKFFNGEEHKALVIDCGGGTTDLSSCLFKIEENNISYKVDIKTSFENGDTNFGGNNLTYRIMQFMKIVFADYYKNNGQVIDIDELIAVSEANLFRYVDEFGINDIYSDLEDKYQVAEKIIPTKYKKYENKSSDDYQKVKNNFYFLWEIAENMKKEFYKKTNILRNKFDSAEFSQGENDLHVTSLNKWNLSIIKDGLLRQVNQFPDVVFNIKEITKLIKADIYNIVRKFLDKFYENGQLINYSILKLTGQSCKIDIFKEALKEFVPGKSIEFKQKKTTKSNIELKLSCLKGVIKYMKAKKLGDIEVDISHSAPIIPYTISAFSYTTVTKQEITLIESQQRINQAKANISKPLSTEEIKFYLKTDEGRLKKEYIYENKWADYESIEVEKLINQYDGKIEQKDTDTIRNNEVKFFLFTKNEDWGFFVLPLSRKDDQLYVGQKKFFAFENDLSSLDFFDGLK